ncbi:MAG: hypothetical protein JXB35_08010 [Anaerolineae bacterium]|nr:hypothetical protein [Anaerolineae bacterium]
MTYLDGLLIVVGVGVVLWGTFRQTVGMLLSWLGLYLVVTAVGMVVLFIGGTYGFGASLVRSLWGTSGSIRLFEAAVFLGLGVGLFLVYEVTIRLIFPNPGLSKLGFWDNVFGGLLGAVLGLVIMALFSNALRVVVITPWQPFDIWSQLATAYNGSFLAPYLARVLRIFSKLLFPFLFLGYPPVLIG